MKPVAILGNIAILAILVGSLNGEGQKGKQLLEGEWRVTSLELDGEKGPPEAIKGLTYTFKGDTLVIAPAEPGANSDFTFKINSEKKPTTIDLRVTKGKDKGKAMSGIFEIDGGSLKICFSGKDRPTEFETKANTDTALVILSRTAKK